MALKDHIVGSWPLNGHCQDVSGYGNHGTPTDVTWGADIHGRTVANFGSGSKVECGEGPSAYISSEYSIETVVKIATIPTSGEGLACETGYRRYGLTLYTDGKLYCYVASGAYHTTGYAAPLNQRIHIIATFDGSHLRMYINGVLKTTSADYSSQSPSGGVGFRLGGTTGSSIQMSGTKLYDVALTPEEVAARYKTSLTQIPNSFETEQPYPTMPDLTDPNLEGAWLNPMVVGAKDASANGKDATVANCRFERDHSATFANGDFTIASTSFDSYGYWYRTSGQWYLYIYNNGTVYTDLVETGSMPIEIGPTGFTGKTGQLRDIRAYTGSITVAQMSEWFNSGVPDSSLVLSVDGRGKDLSRYRNATTAYGGAKIGGRRLDFSQDGYLDCGQAACLNPGTQDFWWSFWVHFNDAVAAGHEMLIVTGADAIGTGKDGLLLYRFAGSSYINIYFSDGSATRLNDQLSAAGSFPAGSYRIDLILDRAGVAQLYKNGVIQSGYSLNISSQSGDITNILSTRLGGYSAAEFRLSGWMDLVRCRIGALPANVADIIQAEYEAERGDY